MLNKLKDPYGFRRPGYGGKGGDNEITQPEDIYTDEPKYIYTDEPEDINSDLFQVFFDTKSDETQYTEEPKESIEAIKQFLIYENNKSEESNSEDINIEKRKINEERNINFMINKNLLNEISFIKTTGGNSNKKYKKTNKKYNKKTRKNRKKTRRHK